MTHLFIFNSKEKSKYHLDYKYVIIFLCLLLFSFWTFEVINRKLMVGDNYAMTKLKSFNSQIDLIEILIIGNSHFHPIESDGFNYKTFNFAVGGSTYYQVYYFLKDNIEKMSSLKSIIINADPLNWSSYNNYSNLNPLLWNKFIDYDELSKIIGYKVLKYRFHFTLLNEVYGRKYFIKNIKHFIKDRLLNNKNISPSKAIKESIQLNGNSDILRRVKKHFFNQNIFENKKLVYFDKLLQLCKNHNISVITVQMPHRNDYIEQSKDFINMKDINNNVLDNPRYKIGILKNIDCYSMFIDHDEYFLGGDHLNEEGSDTISKYLSNEINSVLSNVR